MNNVKGLALCGLVGIVWVGLACLTYIGIIILKIYDRLKTVFGKSYISENKFK